jgi:3-oxoacyl-(acyl-carrier-protein) synthase
MTTYYLNCLGINNSVGASPKEVYESIFLTQTLNDREVNLISERKTQAKEVAVALPELPAHLKNFETRNNRLALHALEQILPQVNAAISKYGKNRVAIILGTSTSGIKETEDSFLKNPEGLREDGFCYYKQEISNTVDFLAAYLEIESLRYTISTACTSSAKVFIEAARLLEAGLCDAVIVGGVDTLSSLTLNGFDSLEAVSAQLTNPFSKNRTGINIGEGAALFLMSKEKSEVAFLGYGESSDAYHISSPDPEGTGAEMALRAALKKAGLTPNDISYINLHGTGTEKNDSMESLVVGKIFGSTVPVSSTKPFMGHTLGAAGAQEAAICYLALSTLNSENLLPPHLWDQEADPALTALSFAKKGERLGKGHCMTNSFAFGGNNVSLIFGKN